LLPSIVVLLAGLHILFFFFSSRRRHTRLVSDWSSDVCSSDLIEPAVARLPVSTENLSFDFKAKRFVRGAALPAGERHTVWMGSRSEERRVGKRVDIGGGRFSKKKRRRKE